MQRPTHACNTCNMVKSLTQQPLEGHEMAPLKTDSPLNHNTALSPAGMHMLGDEVAASR